jgi:hypothetical protein
MTMIGIAKEKKKSNKKMEWKIEKKIESRYKPSNCRRSLKDRSSLASVWIQFLVSIFFE